MNNRSADIRRFMRRPHFYASLAHELPAPPLSHLTFEYFPLQYGRQLSSRHESGAQKRIFE
jgi:hypothetical protein